MIAANNLSDNDIDQDEYNHHTSSGIGNKRTFGGQI